MKAAEESRRHRLHHTAQHTTAARITRMRTHAHSAYRARLPTSARSLAISVRCAFTCFLSNRGINCWRRGGQFLILLCLIVLRPRSFSSSIIVVPDSLFFLFLLLTSLFFFFFFFLLFTFLSDDELIYDLLLELPRLHHRTPPFFRKIARKYVHRERGRMFESTICSERIFLKSHKIR